MYTATMTVTIRDIPAVWMCFVQLGFGAVAVWLSVQKALYEAGMAEHGRIRVLGKPVCLFLERRWCCFRCGDCTLIATKPSFQQRDDTSTCLCLGSLSHGAPQKCYSGAAF
jgi:hypothetical protein